MAKRSEPAMRWECLQALSNCVLRACERCDAPGSAIDDARDLISRFDSALAAAPREGGDIPLDVVIDKHTGEPLFVPPPPSSPPPEPQSGPQVVVVSRARPLTEGERTAEQERADVVAWLWRLHANEMVKTPDERIGDGSTATLRVCLDSIQGGDHVGASPRKAGE